MRREHHARLPRMCFAPARKPPGSLPSLLAAVLIAGVLVALAAVPAEAGGDAFRKETTRAVRAHEKARAQVDRLRAGDARTTEVRSAERRRKAIRAGLWDALWSVARDAGDPVAVDPS